MLTKKVMLTLCGLSFLLYTGLRVNPNGSSGMSIALL